MKKNKIILLMASLVVLIFVGCKKDGAVGISEIPLDAKIWYSKLYGIYEKGVELTDSNYIYLNIQVFEPGTYSISTAELNGYKFSATCEFTVADAYEIKLIGQGVPQTEELDVFSVKTTESEKDFEVQVVSNLSNKILFATSEKSWGTSEYITKALTGRGERLWDVPGYSTSASISGDIICLNPSESITAVNLYSGNEIWSNSNYTNIISLTSSNGSVYAVSANNLIISFNVQSGSVNWEYPVETAWESEGVTVSDNVIYFANKGIHAINIDGTQKWTKDLYDWTSGTYGNYHSNPLIVGDKIYLLRYDGAFQAIDKATGELVWEQQLDTYTSGSPAYFDGKVYINSKLTSYCIDAENGNVLWDYTMEDLDKSPFVVDGKVYLTSDGWGYGIVSLDAVSGQELWTYSTFVCKSDVIAHEDMVYVGSSSYLDGVYTNTGKGISYFEQTNNSDLMVDYDELLAIINKDTRHVAYPTNSGHN